MTARTTLATTSTAIDGFDPDATAFFAELERDNSRAFFTAHRDRYDRAVRAPFLALLDALDAAGAAAWRVYRPNRDTRFQPDRGPYKTFAGAIRPSDDGTGRYLMLDRRGLLAASGAPMLARDQLARYREAVAADASGTAFVAAVGRVQDAGGRVKPGRFEPLTGTPRGYPRDHPRIEQLRWKGVEVPVRIAETTTLPADELLAAVRAAWALGAELSAWLASHVGPTELSPEEVYGGGRRR
jgi:uncharacterized protein (TIGR02453 family)